jgi:hypothetical protein
MVCHRTAQGIQRVVEAYGIPTVMITQHPAVTRMGHPPRALTRWASGPAMLRDFQINRNCSGR